MKLLILALGTMFLQQTFAALGRNLPAIIAPAIIADLALDPAWIGIYVAMASAGALVAQLGCGSFIIRDGALRMSQISLVMVGIALVVATPGPLLFFAVSAILLGAGAAMSTPASSHLLGRYSPIRYAPLVFSLKQTAVPAGLLVAGLLGPLLTNDWGWRGAMLAIGASCIVFAVMLEPTRREFDSDRNPSRRFHLSDLPRTLTVVLRNPGLRNLAIACFAFVGMQIVFVSFFVTYLVTLGVSLATAGVIFSVATLIAVPGRVFWGWFSSVRASPSVVLGALGVGTAASTLLVALGGSLGSLWVMGLAAFALSSTVLSWHGVLLAEAARLAPEGMRGAATGGVLSFGQMGSLVLPLIYSVALTTTGSHAVGFVLCGLPGLVVGVMMMLGGRRRTS